MTPHELQSRIESLAQDGTTEELGPVLQAFFDALESGTVRAASKSEEGHWETAAWVKQGILLAFKHSPNVPFGTPETLPFRDRALFPLWDPNLSDRNVRIVPGGSSVRRGAYLGTNVVMMPPAYVNVGAYVDQGSMIDSHALVGSCAQIGKGVHLSAAAQIGGVLEPIGAQPVIVEDEVFVGGGTGVYEGTLVRQGAVLGAGVILTRTMPIYDLVHETTIRADENSGVLEVPPGAVVIPGSRPAKGSFADTHGLQVQTPIIVKYRDEKTAAGAALEAALR